MPTIDSLLKKIEGPAAAPAEKTASAKTPSLDEQLDSALAQLSPEKTASAKEAAAQASPVKALMKVASEVAEADNDANMKLAYRMGQAFVDGQVERMRQYEKAAEELGTETKTAEQVEAEKAAAYEQGFNETVDLIYKAAAAHFVIGHDAVVGAIESQAQ